MLDLLYSHTGTWSGSPVRDITVIPRDAMRETVLNDSLNLPIPGVDVAVPVLGTQ